MKTKWFTLAVLLGLAGASSSSFAIPPIPPVPFPPPILFEASKKFKEFRPSNGELGLYLVGVWDVRGGQGFGGSTTLNRFQLINPQPETLVAFVAFFDDKEHPIGCSKHKISGNGLAEVQVGVLFGEEFRAVFGVVKIVSTNLQGEPEAGLVGYKKEISESIVRSDSGSRVFSFSESRLQSVPAEVLFLDINGDGIPDELAKIKALCETPQ